jgi:hypothetical protein
LCSIETFINNVIDFIRILFRTTTIFDALMMEFYSEICFKRKRSIDCKKNKYEKIQLFNESNVSPDQPSWANGSINEFQGNL